MTAAQKLRLLLAEDARYDIEAYNFIYEALDWTLKHVVGDDRRPNQHVTGQELLEGVRQYAIDRFGHCYFNVEEIMAAFDEMLEMGEGPGGKDIKR